MKVTEGIQCCQYPAATTAYRVFLLDHSLLLDILCVLPLPMLVWTHFELNKKATALENLD